MFGSVIIFRGYIAKYTCLKVTIIIKVNGTTMLICIFPKNKTTKFKTVHSTCNGKL